MPTKRILSCTCSQSSSDTIRHSGTSTRLHEAMLVFTGVHHVGSSP
jgi:hypothetical protein